ncbi:LysR family transcriptional regulator [Salmonella enterica subsp. salamae]|uniref:LysR family transcriptional regulator n=1 Tax=Salmonella enterica subsp. salamae TaxID=59202 RepID=A0A6D2G159_SALER|nr:LysR family transcriptional regulator [Salmonella enterica subsp. salamae]
MPGLNVPLAFVCHDYSQLAPAVQSAPLMAIVPRPWYENLSDKRGLFALPLAGEQAEGAIFMQYRGFDDKLEATPYRSHSPEIKNVLPINARARIRRAL